MVGQHQSRAKLLFLLPAVLYVSVLLLYPIAYNVNLSLRSVTLVAYMKGTAEFIGLENYRDFLSSLAFRETLLNTLLFYIGSVFFQLVVGFLLSLLFNSEFPLHRLMRSLVLIPLFMPIMVSGTIFRLFFSDGGTINGILMALFNVFGQDFEPISWITSSAYAIYSVTIANIWLGVPFNFIILFTGLQGIPPAIYECAKVDGAGTIQRHWYLTIPMLRPVIFTALILGSIFTLKHFDVVWIMTRGGPGGASHLFSTLSYEYAFERLRFGQGATIALVMVVLILGIVLVLQTIRQKD